MLELEVLKVAAHSLAMIDAAPRHGLPDATPTDGAADRPPRAHRSRAAPRVDVTTRPPRISDERSSTSIARSRSAADPDDPYCARASCRCTRRSCVLRRRPRQGRGLARKRRSPMFRHAPGNNWESSSTRLFLLFSQRFIGDYVTMRAKYEEYKTDACGSRRSLPRFDDAARVRRDVARRGRCPRCGPRARSRDLGPLHRPLPRPALPRAGRVGEIGLYRGVLDERAQPRRSDRPASQLDAPARREHPRSSTTTCAVGSRSRATCRRSEATLAWRQPSQGKQPARVRVDDPDRAGVARRVDDERAATLYERAAEAAKRAGMRVDGSRGAAARLANLRDDAAMNRAAEAELAALGVRDAKRMCALLAPMKRAAPKPTRRRSPKSRASRVQPYGHV